jgi:hypothetical protein
MQVEGQLVEIRRLHHRRDELQNDVLGQRTHHRAKRRPDDHGDGKIDYVAPQNEVAKSLKH